MKYRVMRGVYAGLTRRMAYCSKQKMRFAPWKTVKTFDDFESAKAYAEQHCRIGLDRWAVYYGRERLFQH